MKLLVPLDGSGLSEIVFPWVKLLATEVELLRSYVPLDQLHLAPELPITIAEMVNDDGIDRELITYLDQQAEKLAPLPVTTATAAGSAADCILDHSEAHDAIVMASHGLSGITRWVLGSVTTKVVRASTKPVLVVSARPEKEGDSAPPQRTAKLDKIMVPLDGSDTSKLALKKGVELAQKHGSKLVLYEGVYRSSPSDADDWQVLSAREELGKVAEEISEVEAEVVVHDSRKGPEIAEQAAALDIDMIVMGSHGRSGVSRWVLGSVTEGVIQRSSCPVLIVYGRD